MAGTSPPPGTSAAAAAGRALSWLGNIATAIRLLWQSGAYLSTAQVHVAISCIIPYLNQWHCLPLIFITVITVALMVNALPSTSQQPCLPFA
jgi:hypothetical protein